MSVIPEKFGDLIDAGVSRVLSRAENSRSVAADAVRARVVRSLEKFFAKSGTTPERGDVVQFIDEVRSDDLCLVLACESGDEAAWSDLVANFDSTVKSAARKMSSNNEDAEDLASSIWAELYGLRQDADGKKKSKLSYYSGRGSLGGWLRAVVSQLAVDEFRKQSKYVQIEEDREFENLAESAANNSLNDQVVHHADSPEEQLTQKRTANDITTALTSAIESLEAEDKLILKLYYFDDLKLKDIAATFGYHEATASRRLARIQTDIRKTVEKTLKAEKGWTETEVRSQLADAAAKLGLSFEKILAIFVILGVLQDFYARGVL